MVITEANLDALPPAERIKRIRELQQQKQEELKKGEEDLKRLQQEKMRELRDAQSKLEESVDELELEDEKSQEERSESLEEVLVEQPMNAPDDVAPGSSLERLMPSTLYELSDYNLYGELRRIERKGYMTSDEQRRVSELQRQADTITDAYSVADMNSVDRRRGNFLSRTEEVLKRLDKKMHDVQGNLYDLDERPDHHAVYK